jgi:hypothetical protein
MRTSIELTELAEALTAAQNEFEAVEKTAANPFFKSSYADLPSIIESTAPVLHKHGLSIVQMVGFDPETGNDMLTSRLLHTSGQWIESSMRLFLTKNDPQGQGSAVSYARRYQIQSMLNLRTVDDDANAASKPQHAPQTTKRQPPKAAPAADPETGEVADPNAATAKQLGFMAKLFNDKGFPDDHGVRTTYVSEIVGREVASSKELTKREAGQVIDSLQEESDPF